MLQQDLSSSPITLSYLLNAMLHVLQTSAATAACPLRTCNHIPCLTGSPALRRSAQPRRFHQTRASMSKGELQSTPGVAPGPQDAATKGFIFQQTMYRIKDPKRSLDFYTRVLGMQLLTKLDFPDMSFSLYFLGYCDPSEIPEDPKDRVQWMFSRPATLELTHNWGTENDDTTYHNGNSDPKGYGHIGLAVPDVNAACARFEELGVEFAKRPDDGKMKGLAFIKDPDGYMIEILNPSASRAFA